MLNIKNVFACKVRLWYFSYIYLMVSASCEKYINFMMVLVVSSVVQFNCRLFTSICVLGRLDFDIIYSFYNHTHTKSHNMISSTNNNLTLIMNGIN